MQARAAGSVGQQGANPAGATPGVAAAPAPSRKPPVLKPSQAMQRPSASLDQILAQIDNIRPPERESNYALSVFLVAVVLVTLPLACLLLVVAIVGGLFLIYPPLAIIVGVLVLLLMLKPLLARSGQPSVQYTLNPEQEPVLFQFVARLCHALGAPAPRRIDVDLKANASASFRNGFASALSGGDFVLKIGLPLCNGLSLRQLAGVMAHEFGHFTQGAGMRVTFAFSHAVDWLERIVSQPDAWDLALLRAMQRDDFLSILAWPIYWAFRVTRLIYFWVVNGGVFVVTHMIREMEFDADRYEIQVAGTETFCQTSVRLYPLHRAIDWASGDLRQAWLEKRLSDNIPAMVLANVAQLEKEPGEVAKIRRQVWQSKTKWYDSHPCPAERMQRAQQINAPGMLTLDASPTILFADFDKLCKEVTAEFYKQELGLTLESWNVVSSETIISEQEMHFQAMKTLSRFFQGELLGAYQIFPAAIAPEGDADPQQARARLHQKRQQMLAGLDRGVEVLQRYRNAEARIRDMTHAWVILDSGFSFNPHQFGLVDANYARVGHELAAARQARDLAHQQLASVVQSAQDRLGTALQLLHVPGVSQRINNVAHEIKRCGELQRTLVMLQQVWPDLLQMSEHTITLELLLDVASEIGGQHLLYNRLFHEGGQVARTLNDVRWKLTHVLYPFPHAHGQISVANYALSAIPPVNEPVQLYKAANEFYDKLMNLYYRAIAYLAMTAEKVEDALGLGRLPEPFASSSWDPLAPPADITVQ